MADSDVRTMWRNQAKQDRDVRDGRILALLDALEVAERKLAEVWALAIGLCDCGDIYGCNETAYREAILDALDGAE